MAEPVVSYGAGSGEWAKIGCARFGCYAPANDRTHLLLRRFFVAFLCVFSFLLFSFEVNK